MSNETQQAVYDAAGAFYRGTGPIGELVAAVKAHESDEKPKPKPKPKAATKPAGDDLNV